MKIKKNERVINNKKIKFKKIIFFPFRQYRDKRERFDNAGELPALKLKLKMLNVHRLWAPIRDLEEVFLNAFLKREKN